jgi:hypothetical protein
VAVGVFFCTPSPSFASSTMSRSLSLAVFSALLSSSYGASTPSPSSSNIITPNVQSIAPSGAVGVSPVLISFSLEGDKWPQWAANPPNFNAKNDFFHNALKGLRDRTGVWPNIRVGANSEDRTAFDDMIKVSLIISFVSTFTDYLTDHSRNRPPTNQYLAIS